MNHDALHLVLVDTRQSAFVWKWNVTSFPRRMNQSHVMVGKRSHPLPNSSPSSFAFFWRCCCSILILPPDRKAGTAWNREICLVLAEGDMGKGVELFSPGYFSKNPILKDLEQEERISSWYKVMVLPLSLPVPRPLCALVLLMWL